MNLRQVAERAMPFLPKEMKEFQARVDELLPFRPPVPVDELVAQAALFLAQELGDELTHIQHFGSTAYPDGKPHRRSDIDLMAVVTTSKYSWEVERRLKTALSKSQLRPGLFHFAVCSEQAWDDPQQALWGEEVILRARIRGKPVPIPRSSAGKTSQTLE